MNLNLARYAEKGLHLLATAFRELDRPYQKQREGYCGCAELTVPTPKPVCKTPSEMDAMMRQRNALPLHSPLRGPMNKALYSERHNILRTKGKTQ